MNEIIEIETEDIVFVWRQDSKGIEEIILPVIPLTVMIEDDAAYTAKIILTPIENKDN